VRGDIWDASPTYKSVDCHHRQLLEFAAALLGSMHLTLVTIRNAISVFTKLIMM